MVSIVGRFEDGSPVPFDFAAAMHSVVGGSTRSGKSTFVYSVLASAAEDTSVVVTGIDPSGVLLAPFQRSTDDWRVRLGTQNPDAAVATLASLVEVMDARILALHGRLADKVPSHAFGPRYPILVVVLEEYAGFLDALRMDDAARRTKNEPAVRIYVGRLLREGAKVGFRLLTLLQRAEAAVLHDRAQYARRIAFRLDNADSVRMLHEAAPLETVRRLMSARPGVGLLHEAGEPLKFFRAPMVGYSHFYQSVTRGLR